MLTFHKTGEKGLSNGEKRSYSPVISAVESNRQKYSGKRYNSHNVV